MNAFYEVNVDKSLWCELFGKLCMRDFCITSFFNPSFLFLSLSPLFPLGSALNAQVGLEIALKFRMTWNPCRSYCNVLSAGLGARTRGLSHIHLFVGTIKNNLGFGVPFLAMTNTYTQYIYIYTYINTYIYMCV